MGPESRRTKKREVNALFPCHRFRATIVALASRLARTDEPAERPTELRAGREQVGGFLGGGEDQVERRLGRPRRRDDGQNAERQHHPAEDPWKGQGT